jgi:hypothetical protein
MNRVAFRIVLAIGVVASWVLTTAEVWPTR